MFVIFSQSEFGAGSAAIALGSLNTMEMIGSWGCRGQVMAFNHQRQGERGYRNKKQSQISNNTNLPPRDL